MNESALTIRNKLYDFIRVADDKKLSAIYHLLESDIEQTTEWWENHAFTKELEQRFEALENRSDKGYSIAELETSISKLRKKRNG